MPISLSLLQPTLLADGCLSNDSLWEICDFPEEGHSSSWKALRHVESTLYFVIKPKGVNLEFSLQQSVVIGSGSTRNPIGAFVIEKFP